MMALHLSVSVIEVEALDDYKLRLEFSDGTIGIFDMLRHRDRYQGPVFQPLWANLDIFRSVWVEGDSIVWACGADIAPERLYELSEPLPLAEENL